MKFHPDAVRDCRTRIYLPPVRILLNHQVQNAELLLGNVQIQTSVFFLPTLTVLSPGSSLVLDYGEALHGGILFNSPGKPGHLKVNFGESVSEAIGSPNEDHSRREETLTTPSMGIVEYGNTVFRFVRLENVGDTELSCAACPAVALERDLEVTGAFESSDSRLNRIWTTAVRTVHLCMQTYLYDGAKRDRLVWMGDMHPETRGVLCAFSDASVIRDSLDYLIGQTPSPKPMNTIPSYACWFIISLWDYYMGTGDSEFLLKHADYIRALLNVYKTYIGKDGSETLPDWRFLDWPNEDNPAAKHAGLQALLLWMMEAGEKLVALFGDDPKPFRAAQRKLRRHVPSPEGRKAPAALLQLMKLGDFRNVLETNPFNGVSTFYGFYVLLAKETKPALDLIRTYWGGMMDYGATSFWEDFDLEWLRNTSPISEPPVPGKDDLHADFGKYCYIGLRHSLSHGWSCGPAPFMSERVLGVRFLKPGGSQIQVTPDLGDLEYVSGAFPTPKGALRITADASGKVDISAPAGIEIVTNPPTSPRRKKSIKD